MIRDGNQSHRYLQTNWLDSRDPLPGRNPADCQPRARSSSSLARHLLAHRPQGGPLVRCWSHPGSPCSVVLSPDTEGNTRRFCLPRTCCSAVEAGGQLVGRFVFPFSDLSLCPSVLCTARPSETVPHPSGEPSSVTCEEGWRGGREAVCVAAAVEECTLMAVICSVTVFFSPVCFR